MDAMQVQLVLSKRVSVLVDWLIIAAIHQGLAMLGLLCLWWWHVTPQGAAGALRQFLQSQSVAILGLLGVSGATVAGLWLRLLFVVVRRLTTSYVCKPIRNARMRAG